MKSKSNSPTKNLSKNLSKGVGSITKGLDEVKKKEPKVVKEFKEFINRGNVVDLAVGVAVGGAFTAIVTSLVNDIIMPVVSMIIGGFDFTNLKLIIPSFAGLEEPATINYGNFIQAIVNFLVVALVIFFVVRAMNNMKKKTAPAPVEDKSAKKAEDAQTEILKEIRDLLRIQNKK